MKKTFIIAAGLLIMATGSYVAFAQRGAPNRPGWGRQQNWQPKCWQSEGCGPTCGCPLHMGMGRMLMGKQMQATPDGGLIVMVGFELFKYDKDLKLVGQTQVKVDTQAIEKRMQKMIENCPMRKQMMQSDDEEEEEEEQEGRQH